MVRPLGRSERAERYVRKSWEYRKITISRQAVALSDHS